MNRHYSFNGALPAIAEAFGGVISVNSILKKGSEFIVMLPNFGER